MKINTVLKEANLKLKKNKILNPKLEAELILSKIIIQPREYILAHPEKKLSQSQIENYKLQINQRIKGMPVAYITGHKQFYGLDFKINKYVLIPRPETELMVDEALGLLHSKSAAVIDIGTGSGCIIVTLAKKIKADKKEKGLSREFSRLSPFSFAFKFFATDISKKALIVAHQNAEHHNVNKNIKFLHGNLLKPILNNKNLSLRNSLPCRQAGRFLLLANLPYLTPSDIKHSPTIQHEPRKALVAGSDGLKYYRQLFKQITSLKKMLCITCYVLCEIDPHQTNKIKQLAKNELPQAEFQIKKDLKGHNRLIIIKICP